MPGERMFTDEIQVTELEARQYAEENGIYAFLETSAKTGRNVQEAFISAVRGILTKDGALKLNDRNMIGMSSPNLASSTTVYYVIKGILFRLSRTQHCKRCLYSLICDYCLLCTVQRASCDRP
ncbi:hypothetical protein EG68_02109 [Paragonimus skrjabini miyazakii]|uniref:Uncharacterized protein n=1 Tax=Paragonimus skrjabini miyazakii TaxID=59628 RepID=A0A8S9Z4G4_9TREM|nr:hypothetical protein EG68_02109 [Paragonimus skrjabini miyazakii]